MTYTGEVTQQKTMALEVEITLSNVRRVGAADYHDYTEMTFRVPFGVAHCFAVSRTVEVKIKPKRRSK